MILNWDTLWSLLQSAGLPGVIVGVCVAVFVFIGTQTDLLKNGTLRRIAVTVAAALFSGYTPGELHDALVMAIGVCVATALKLLADVVVSGVKQVAAARAIKAK